MARTAGRKKSLVIRHRPGFSWRQPAASAVDDRLPVYFNRISTLAAWAVRPSLAARRQTSSAKVFMPFFVKESTLDRRRKSLTDKPLAKRAVPPVGSTCEGPAA